jgi:protein-L-isoaspartate O-methyltransferase
LDIQQTGWCLQAGLYIGSLRVGDGTLGWAEAAPFDAILVAAGGPRLALNGF